jgi:hypothetical protein
LSDCKLKLFEIERVGLFDYAHTPKITDVTYFLELLRSFIKGRTAKNSRMSTARKEEVYCYDIEKLANGDFIVILWLGITSYGNRKILSLPKNGVIGCDLKQAKGDASGIIGMPAYFYISVATGSIVVMEFPGASGDSSLLTNYLSDFVHNYSGHGVKKDKETVLKADPSNEEDKACYFSFAIKRFTSKTIEEYLRMNFSAISSVMMKDKITATETVTRDLGAVFNALRPWVRKTAGEVTKSSTVSISVPVNFKSLAEIDEYIECVKVNGKQDTVGFKVTKKTATDMSQNIYYLNGTQARKASAFDLNGKEWPYKASDLVSFFNKNNKIQDFIDVSHNPLGAATHSAVSDDTVDIADEDQSMENEIEAYNA